MARGGKRAGAGRKPGTITKMAQAAVTKAHATGDGRLPHEILLALARGEKVSGFEPQLQHVIDAAKAAAPYFAPRMAVTDVNMKGGNPFQQLFDIIHAGGRKGLIQGK